MSSKYLLPQELNKPPIEEALFELRFALAPGADAAAFHSHMRTALGAEHPRSAAIQNAAVSHIVRRSVPDARHIPTFELSGDHRAVLLGDGVVALRLTGRYPGWDVVRGRIESLLDHARRSKSIGTLEEVSLKFVNVLRDPPPRQLEALRVDVRVNGEAVSERGLFLRMELSDERYVRIVELRPGATGPFLEPDPNAHGLMLALECRRGLEDVDFWAERADVLENLHFELRALFFRLLSRDEIEKLGPVYRQAPES